MIGAIAGDIIGSRFEFNNISNEDFELFAAESKFTDDSVLTVATAGAILEGVPDGSLADGSLTYGDKYFMYAEAFPNRGYGAKFLKMVRTGRLKPYNSFGNGSAMRISPIGWAFETEEETLREAKESAECTHNHLEGVKGAQATALAIFMARNGASKGAIRDAVADLGYDLKRKTKDFDRTFDETCQKAIPRAMAIILDTDDYESAIRKAVSMGGDVDTIACIVGGIAQALYGMPPRHIVEGAYRKLQKDLATITTIFTRKFIDPGFVAPKEIGVDPSSSL